MSAVMTPKREKAVYVGALLLVVAMLYIWLRWVVATITGLSALLDHHPLSREQFIALWASGLFWSGVAVLYIVTGGRDD